MIHQPSYRMRIGAGCREMLHAAGGRPADYEHEVGTLRSMLNENELYDVGRSPQYVVGVCFSAKLVVRNTP